MEPSARAHRIRQLLLSVDNRRAVYERIVQEPGTHLRALCRDLGLAVGSVEHHLRQLERHGLVFAHQDGRRRAYFASGHVGRDEAATRHVLMHPTRRRIVEALLREGGAELGWIATQLGIRASIASFHLKKLLGTGVVENVRAGRISLYAVADPAHLQRLGGAGAPRAEPTGDDFELLLDAARRHARAADPVLVPRP